MEQKIIQIGNSWGIILPKTLAEKVGLRLGKKVFIQEDATSSGLVLNTSGRIDSSITAEFVRILKNVNKRYGKALKELASK